MSGKIKKHSYLHILQEIVMIGLAVFSLFLLINEVYTSLNLATFAWSGSMDLVVSAIFFGDFFLHYRLSPNKPTFFRRHWYELFAAFPFISPLSGPLIAISLFGPFSLLHVLRVIRLIIRMRILLEASFEYTHHSYLIYIFTTVCVVIFSGSAGFYFFEYGANPNIYSYWDAVWWAIVTATTIGYGDIFPITPGGRIVAVAVMLIGITALGTFIASVNSLFIGSRLEKMKKNPRN